MKTNLLKSIIKAANGEPIEAVVIGNTGWDDDYKSEDIPNYDKQPKYQILSLDEATPWLNYEYDNGFGAPGCNAIYAWTPTKVIFISQYDGSTDVEIIPRHPNQCKPMMPGG